MFFKRTKASEFSRRRFLQVAAGASACVSAPISSAFGASTQTIAFLKASSLLCGLELDRSYIQLGERIWAALTQEANVQDQKQWQRLIDALAKLPSTTPDAHLHRKISLMGPRYLDKAKRIAKVWYTGRIVRKTGPKTTTIDVIDYDDALVWRACSFTKPPVTCGGHFGYWQHPYSGTGDA